MNGLMILLLLYITELHFYVSFKMFDNILDFIKERRLKDNE